MLNFIRTLWNICLLRGGPQDVPYSMTLVSVLVAINYFLIVAFVTRTQGTSNALWMTAVSVGISCLAIYIVLRFRNVAERLVQTISALFGTNVLLSAVAMVILFVAIRLSSITGMTAVAMLGQLIAFGLAIWTLIVAGHIFRNALAIPLFLGVILSIGIELLNAVVFRAMIAGG